MTIGQYSVWSATAAREEARELRRKIDRGIDPLAERKDQEAAAAAEREAPTMRSSSTRTPKSICRTSRPGRPPTIAASGSSSSCLPWAK